MNYPCRKNYFLTIAVRSRLTKSPASNTRMYVPQDTTRFTHVQERFSYSMTLSQALRDIQEKLTPVAGDCAQGEAERILTFLLRCSRAELHIEPRKELAAGTEKKIQDIIRRRAEDEPLAYIVGSEYFYNREFAVTSDVLIPRPDTEVLVEEVLKKEPEGSCCFLDLGTGSGCIAAVLVHERPQWKAVASDISFPALKTARKNSPDGFMLLCADRLLPIKNRTLFDFIVTNPPYISSVAIETLESSVRCHEPRIALHGGPDGLDFYCYLAGAAKPLLKDRGRIYCEIGFDQGKNVPAIFHKSGWLNVTAANDNAGRSRVVRAVKGGNKK